jgi:hypothetical protein
MEHFSGQNKAIIVPHPNHFASITASRYRRLAHFEPLEKLKFFPLPPVPTLNQCRIGPVISPSNHASAAGP